MRRTLFSASAILLLLSACASASGVGSEASPRSDFIPQAATRYGSFLAGQAALSDGRSAEAATYFSRAQDEEAAFAAADADDPAFELLSERAFVAALLAGDVSRAAAMAPQGPDASEAGARLGALTRAVEFIARGDGDDAYAILIGDKIGFPHKTAAVLLAPWAAATAKDVEGSLVRPEIRGDRLVEYVGQFGQAALFERAGRYDEAETDLKALALGERATDMAILAYGGFLERRGRRAEAIALYDSALVRDPRGAALEAALKRARAHGRAPRAPTLREGAAQTLLTPAAALIAAEQKQLALAYLRLALRLDPRRSEAWLMVGDLLAAGGDLTGATEAYGRVAPSSPDHVAAQAKLAWAYQEAGDSQRALSLAQAGARGGSLEAQLTFADLLRANERFADSAEILTKLIAAEGQPDWRLLYARGVAYERTGQWPLAEADLKAALALQPDEPELLNYLGYSWIDRGENLKEALSMVERAVAANPRNGAMIDSLAWAHYRLGDYPKAVELLEQAVELEAGDPEINLHLGDAYWRVGRRDEAGFQWKRVLTLEPDARIKGLAEARLTPPGGLPEASVDPAPQRP